MPPEVGVAMVKPLIASARVAVPALFSMVELPVKLGAAVPVIAAFASRVNGTSTNWETVLLVAPNAVTARRTLRLMAAPVTIPAPVTVQTPVDWFTVAVAKVVAAPGPPPTAAVVTVHVQLAVALPAIVSPVGVTVRAVATFAFVQAELPAAASTVVLALPDTASVPVAAGTSVVFVTPMVSVAAFAAVL